MKKFVAILLAFVCPAFYAPRAVADYKQVLISTTTNAIRVHLPLTGVAEKVRVKRKSSNGFGIASQQHNEDIRQILGKILEMAKE